MIGVWRYIRKVTKNNMKQLRFCVCLALIVLANIPFIHAQGKPYTLYIKAHGEEPMSYIADKIRTYSVVCLGEDHWIKDHPQFLCDVIRAMTQDSTANIDVLAVEFGNESDQRLADTVAYAPTYREDLVFKILQHTPDIYGNPYREYADVFRTVWETNKAKSPKLRTRILLLDPAYMQEHFDGEKYTYTGSRDDNMFGHLRWCIMKRKHTLFYAGQAHTQAQIGGVLSGDYYYNYPSAGYLLKKCYPRDVFSINLWGARMGSNGYMADSVHTWQRIANGIIDEAFRENGNKPVAFTLSKDFPLTVEDYYADPANPSVWQETPTDGSPYTSDLLMRDQINGIIFIKPVEQFSGAHLLNIYDEDFMRHVKKRSGGKITTPQGALAYVKEHHPILETE